MSVSSFLNDDKTIRLKLVDVLNNQNSEKKIIHEFSIGHGSVRIDIAVVDNKKICGYEIKSDRDTLCRLPTQVQEYNTVFDEVTLLVAQRHILKAIEIIPVWWGVTTAISDENDLFFHIIRKPIKNHKKQDALSIARLLWRNEALAILEDNNKADGVRSKNRYSIYKRLSESFDPERLKQLVMEKYLSRHKMQSVVR